MTTQTNSSLTSSAWTEPPQRKVPGWLYALIFTVTLAAYCTLVLTGHEAATSSLLLAAVPILGGVFVADRVSATTQKEGEKVRTALTNGALTTGLLNAFDHPDVKTKLTGIISDVVSTPTPLPPATPPAPAS